MNTEQQRLQFWKLYKDVLMENGEPFTIGTSERQWANINEQFHSSNKGLIIEYLVQKGILRIGVYLDKEVTLYNKLYSIKNELEELSHMKFNWRNGEKGKDTRRIFTELYFDNYDGKISLIEDSLSIAKTYIDTFSKYLR